MDKSNKIFLEIVKRAHYSISHELGQLTKLPDRTGARYKRLQLLKLREQVDKFAEQ